MDEPKKYSKFVIGDRVYETTLTKKFERRKPYVPADPKLILCAIPGIIQQIHVKKGQRVRTNESLLVVEAMKMQNDILSHLDGVVKRVAVQVGQMATKGQILVEFE